MSIEAYAYVRRLTLGKNPGRKLVLANLADTVDNDTKSWAIKPVVLAVDSEMETRQAQNHLKALAEDGYISALDRFNDQGKQTVSRLRLHGPWDLWGGTGTPFPESEQPKKDRRLDTYTAQEVTDEDRAELRRRFQDLAAREGFFRDGKPRARWRLGSRAHSIVYWYGIGNTVIHANRKARVVEITDRDGKHKAPTRVRLDYGNGPTKAWVRVENLTDPAKTSEEKPSSDGVQPSAPTPDSGVQPSAPLPPQYLSAPRPQAAQDSTDDCGRPEPGDTAEEEESPSAETQRGVLPVDLVVEATDATHEEAQQLVEVLRPEAKKSLGGLIRRMAEKGDLDHRLWLLRRQRAPQSRAGATGDGRAARCSLHVPSRVPCGSCRGDLAGVGAASQAVIDLYISLGPDAATLRPDLARHPKIAALAAV
ncbi:hypothetical protein Q8791_27235 [Nocardiopsis sp. CT-R113]|uniref:Uncharacterized protein n=1 Tax=Nocardiopsis codii TaxID=3065942 RepID=A0ABU7KFC2_9ACTN|nr:hypothetical protein [Nocardiopsis sp. CT-R113]MEE2040920.1 hypothetical protein [Nocardiopsis sp. CT-R113]